MARRIGLPQADYGRQIAARGRRLFNRERGTSVRVAVFVSFAPEGPRTPRPL